MESRYWFRPVFSVALRDIKITLRYKSRVAALLVWPVIFPLTFYFMGKGLAGTTGQGLSNFEHLAQTGDYASLSSIGKFIPLTHFVNIIRRIIIHKQSLFTYRDLIIFITVAVVLMFLVGVLVFELTKRSVKSR